MRLLHYITNLTLLLFLVLLTEAQPFNTEKRYTDRYSLELPDDFKTSKFIEALTDVLPRITNILKDRPFCMGCTGCYNARLEISKPVINNKQCMENTAYIENSKTFTYTFNYHFGAYISIIDSLNNQVGKIEIISPETQMVYSKDFSIRIVYDYYNQTVDGRGRIRYADKVARPIDPWDYVAKNDKGFALDKSELVDIVEQKIYELKHYLDKIH